MVASSHFGCPKIKKKLSHFLPFQTDTTIFIFVNFFSQNGYWRPFWMSENHFRSHFWPFQIDRPFWMSEFHFRSHFWPFQIDMELFIFYKIFDKMAADGHFRDVRKLLSIAFLAIYLDEYCNANINGSKLMLVTMHCRFNHGGHLTTPALDTIVCLCLVF